MSHALDGWLTPGTTLMVLAPHPDDDVLGCARLMQRAEARGCSLVVIWLTDGGASHGALSQDERADLTRRRHAEALAGVATLGVKPTTYFLGHPDGHLASLQHQAMRQIQDIMRRYPVTAIAVTDKDDGHPDHRAAYAIALGLPGPPILSYPVSTRFDGNPYAPPPGALLLAAGPGDGKRAALLEHRSQMETTAVVPMSLATIERFCGEPEFFLPVRKASHVG